MIAFASQSRSGKIRIVVGLLLVAAAFLAVTRPGQSSWRAPEQTGRVSVLSYNVLAAAAPSSETLQVIQEAGADVVCLQEVGPAVHRYLRRNLQSTHPHTLYRNAVGGYGGLAFYSRYGLRDVGYLTKAGGARFPAWIVRAQTPAGEIQILQVHLRPRVADIGGRIVGHFTIGWTHRREIKHFRAALDPKIPTIVAGDFNEGDTGLAIEFLERNGFTNALPLFDATSDTWRGSVYRVRIGVRLDHVLFSQHFECTTAGVMQGGGSDHSAVYASLMRPESDQASTGKVEVP